jgi:hypothetical protein
LQLRLQFYCSRVHCIQTAHELQFAKKRKKIFFIEQEVIKLLVDQTEITNVCQIRKKNLENLVGNQYIMSFIRNIYGVNLL